MATVCPNIPAIIQDPRFQKIKEIYKYKNWSDFGLAVLLKCYREDSDLDPDFYPETEEELMGFADFLNRPNESSGKLKKEDINNLYKTMSTLFQSPKQLNQRLDLISRWFTDALNKRQKEHPGLSRQQVLSTLSTNNKSGFQVIMEDVFKQIEERSTIEWQKKNVFDYWHPNATEEEWETARKKIYDYRAAEFKKLADNKDFLSALAAPKIGAIEGIAVKLDGMTINIDTSEEDYEDDFEGQEDNGVDQGEAQKGDRYVDFRVLSLMSTLSTEAKQMLRKLYRRNPNGTLVRDDLGYTVPVDIRQMTLALHRTLRFTEPKTLMEDLQKASTQYPDIRSLIMHLKENPDDATLVYTTFKKSKVNYYYGYKGSDGKLAINKAGNIAEGYALASEAGANISSGLVSDNEFNVVDASGRVKDLDFFEKESKDYTINHRIEEIDWQNYNTENDKYVEELSKRLEGVGFKVSPDELKSVFTSYPKSTRFNDGYSSSYTAPSDRLTWAIRNIYDKGVGVVKAGRDLSGSNLYNYAKEDFAEIAKVLSPLSKGEAEERIISRDKSLSTNITPNALHQLVDLISNVRNLSKEEFEKQLMQNFGQFEGMGIGYGDDLRMTGWLADMCYPKRREVTDYWIGSEPHKTTQEYYSWKPEYFKLIDMADSNKTDYADLSEVQHLINSYVMYARAGQTRTDPWAGRAYEVPIQADYETAYNFIVAPSYTRDKLIENLAQEVECEIQRIAAIRERKANDPKDPNAELTRAQLLGYEKRGQEFQIFPELNTNGFINRYYATNSTLEAGKLVRQEVDKQLVKLLEAERNRITELGMFSDENKSLLGNVSDSSINDWILNSFYARQQMTKLMYGGLEHFKSIADFEKRNMYAHAQRLPLYTEATYKGEHVGKEYQRVVYLSDDESRSAIYDKICSIADKLESEKKISKDQCKRMKEAYKEITSTDGQGIRTLDSMRSIKIMSGIWTDEDEQAYKNIKNGNYTPDDAQHFMVGIKPVYTGYEIIPAENGTNQKPIRVPVLHKYSEMVLLPEMLEGLNQQNDSVPFKALNRINKALGKDRQIDLFIFGSGVKVGGHSLINAFAKDEDGNRILKDADSIADFTLNKLNSGSFWVHNLPLKYYGITSSMHADVEDKAIAWASQAEKEAWANILPEDNITLPSGKPMSSLEARELYNKIKTARVIDAFKEVRKIFYSPHRMATLMKEELASKPYQSREMAFYLQVLDSGNNSLDLFSPNIQHDAVALLSSILKKRLTKFPTKGANITQTSGFGLDTEIVTNSFDDRGALKESDKLGIKTDKQGHTYVEAYVPIYDSRLEQFADSNGNITADRLDDLVKRGIIPESCLYFIGYRTPSDAEHSIIPCKIKGFIANTAGASIRLPKEIMVMTGHDYDGDKMRCHFKDFYVGWDDQKIRKDYEKFSDSEAIKDILDDSREVVVTPYEVFRKNAIADTNPEANKYRIVKEVKYDYEKTPLENIGEDNDYRALNNALVDLMFSQLSSPTGIEKMMIPGGSTETTIYARTMQIMHAFGTTEGKAAIKKALKENKLSDEQIESKTKNTIVLYNYLIERGEKELTSIVNTIEGNSSPFTVSHASEAQNYMMSGAKMIGIYAVYNSASAMFQRLNLHYIPKARRFGENKGEPVHVSLFNKPIDKLFAVEKNKPIPTLGLARLVNAAVDNGKNPVLGHLNQTEELAPLTNFLFAAGLSEEEVHLLLNQPAIIELGNKMKGSDSPSFTVAANSVVRAIQGTMKDGAGRYSLETSVEKVSAMPKEMFIESLSTSFANLLSGNDTLRKSNQIHILQTLEHIYGAVSDLDQFSKLTRPESNSGGIDSTLGGTVAKLFQLNDFREKVSSGNCNISGVNGVIERKEILYNVMTPKMIEEKIGDELPEVTVLNTLLKDNAPKLFWQWFPQVRNSWRRVAKSIAGLYSYQNVPGKVIERIQSDMLLWKLLSSTEFIEGDPQEEQKRIIEETPKRLKELKMRILEASNNPGKDPLADLLSTNLFLNNLEIGSTVNANNEEVERIRFKQNGPAVEDTADLIRAGWDELYRYADTYQLALDLFKYNLYTNGFSYGRYEFAHYAPYSIVRDTPGYQNALFSLLRSGWSEEEENQFMHQYCRNHWGDKNFLVKVEEDKLPINVRQMIGIETPSRTMMKPSDFETSVIEYPYIIIHTKKKQKEYTTQVTYNWQDGRQERQIELSDDEDKLYEIIRDDSGRIVDIKEAAKLGLRNHSNQVMVQYNPRIRDYRELRPIFKSNDVAWESKKSLSAMQADDQSGQSATDEAARQNAIDDIPFSIPIPTGESVASLQEQAARAAADNDGKFTAEQAAILGFEDEGPSTELDWSRFSDNGYEVSSAGDSRFSAMNARFKEGTVLFGHDVSNRTIESVYQHGVKQGDWKTDDIRKTGKPSDKTIIKGNTEDDSFFDGYLPLWAEWARQNSDLIQELRVASAGKTLTDKFASTRVSQARALATILNSLSAIGADRLYSLPRSYGRNQSYGNSKKATKAEREELLSIIQQKKYPESGTDIISLDTNDHKIIYLVDHSSDSELYENLREGGDGFGIRKTFEKDKITANDVRTILRNIASDYGYSATRARKVLQDIGIRPEVMSGVDIAAELKMGSGVDARMDTSGRGQGISPEYNGSSPDGRESSYGLDENGGERGRTLRGGTELSIVERDSEGKPVRKQYPATPRVISEARRQKVFAELNKKLREILQKHGVSIGSLYESEARLMAAGVSDFSSAKVLAEGMKELIRLANGIEGEYALPEEFAHVAIEMLGHDHPLVSRLLTTLSNNEKALEEAYDGMLDAYREQYGNDHDKLVLEAAGKLVAKQLFKHQLAKTNSIRNLVTRICNAIKDFFRRFSTREIDEAILDSEGIASQLARELVSGKLADEMSLEKITSNGKFFSVDKNLTDKQDLMSKLLKRTVKLKDVLSRRVKYSLAHGATNRSLEETENQIAKLEAAIQNQKLETAVVDYLKDAMSFMSEMEKSLDDAINNRPANAVCKKLQITKDTLFGFAGVIEDVRDAISNGEIQDDADLKTALRDVSYQIEDFWDKYNRISLLYFEKFLSNVYGEEGLTVNVGRNKGKKITIHEMATKADHDVSFLGRMLHAASDINDYILQAVDRVTRDAKFSARSRVRSLRPRFEAAFEALIKEQGNRDQSWMFERDSNGNLTGKYITQAKANTLSDARKNFYNVFMELKTMADNCVPDAMITNSKTGLKEHRRIIMMRKEHYEKMKSAHGISEKGAEEWDSIKNSVLEMSDDLDVENEQVITDFAGNKVDMLPLKFLNKGKKESFNDMTEDTASSLMAYLGMAFEYQEMNNVIGLLENARYMSSRRDVAQKSGSRNKIEDVGNEEEFHYRKPFTVKQARSNLQKAIDDFYQMHVYGHLRKDEGTFGKTRISKRKAADTLNRFASLSQMALNLQQRIANVNTGFTQILVESAGGKIKAKDVAWASGLWMAQSADRMAETGKTDYNNKLSLWMDYFDIHQDNGREVKLTKYSRTRGSRVFNEGLLYAGLTVGEDFMAGTTALALARTYKLKGPDGKESNMWDAYEVKYADSKNKTGAYLSLKKGYTKQDGSAITQEDEKKFMREVIGTNFELQGIYNTDDRSAIQQYSLGALAIMYRKWIAPALKRRYAGVHYSNLKGDFQEGYYNTAFRLLGDDLKDIFKPVSEEESNKTIMQILTDFNAMKTSINLNWNKLNDYEKGNIKKAMTELAVTACLVIASALLANLPDDDDDNKFVAWAEDIAITQLLRLRSEIGSQAPTPMLAGEALRIMSSPFAALKPIKDSLNIFQLMWIPNYHEEVKSGRYKGRTKAHKYFMSLPIISMFRKFDNFVDPTPLINYYRNQNY